MAPQEILKFKIKEPFQPFRLYMSDGSIYDVMDPFQVHVDMLSVSVGVKPDEETGVYARSIYLSPNHVTRIEPLNESAIEEPARG